jgi:hypothetical protein
VHIHGFYIQSRLAVLLRIGPRLEFCFPMTFYKEGSAYAGYVLFAISSEAELINTEVWAVDNCKFGFQYEIPDLGV